VRLLQLLESEIKTGSEWYLTKRTTLEVAKTGLIVYHWPATLIYVVDKIEGGFVYIHHVSSFMDNPILSPMFKIEEKRFKHAFELKRNVDHRFITSIYGGEQ
jgi:hypothetical protein